MQQTNETWKNKSVPPEKENENLPGSARVYPP